MAASARSLADDLRLRSDTELQQLFRLRPDLLRPVPKSFADLALRANGAASTRAALDDLTRAELDVLEACCALAVEARFTARDVAHGLAAQLDAVQPVLDSLFNRMLLWGAMTDLRVPSAVREAMGPAPAGLDACVRRGLPGVRAALRDPDALRAELAAAPRHVRAAVMAAAWNAAATSGIEDSGEVAGLSWLRSRGLFATDDVGPPRIPREIALVLRHGLLLDDASLTPPPAGLRAADAATADPRAGHEADQFLRDLDRTLAALVERPWARQGNGTIGARDVDRAITATALTPARLGLVVTLAHASGQLDLDSDGRLRPTTTHAEQMSGSRADRWARLAVTWLCLPTAVPEPARLLVARPDTGIRNLRRLVLLALAAGAGFEVTRWLSWHRPRLRADPHVVDDLLAEAEALGFTVGALPSAMTRDLQWPPEPDSLAAGIEPLLPPLTDRIVLQADLTATALGPLDPATERRLARVATWESGGAATVFRFAPDSVRRGLASGEDADDLLAWLALASATEVPQALSVLVADQARTLPRLTLHAARAVVECTADDADAVVADPALADLRLRRIAPGIVVADVGPGELADRLRAAGHAVLAATAAPEPATAETTASAAPDHLGPTPERVIRTLRTIERREESAQVPPRDVGTPGPAGILRGLDDASRSHRRVWLAFADESGLRLTHLVEPLALESGDVCAFDVTAGEIRTIPVERIVGLAAVDA